MTSKRSLSLLSARGSGSSSKRAKSPAQANSTFTQNQSSTLTSTSPSTNAPQLGTSSREQTGTTGHTMLSTLNASMKVLRKGCHVFKPLESAVGALLSVLESIENAEESSQRLHEMASDLPQWAMVLSKYLSSSQPEQMSKCVEKLAVSLMKQAEFIREQQQRGRMRPLAESKQDIEELEKCYRRIEISFRQLQADTALSTWKTADDILKDSRLNTLSPAHDARYDSSFSDEIKRGGCFENTRVAVLGVIRRWIRGEGDVKIYWANGMAGTGKTTIAYSVCAELKQHGRLGASFFCSRTSPECRSVGRILPTIAYQLAKQFYPFRSSLCRILGHESDIGQRNVSAQFEYLIQIPLLEAKDMLPTGLVVVIDALDECSDPATVETMLYTLFRNAAHLPVRFFLTSRPEPAITNAILARDSHSRSILHLHNVEEQLVKADIETYLTVTLAKLSLTSGQIKQLTDQAGILFIYAATAARYLLAAGYGANASSRLATVLARSPKGANKKDREIDRLYKSILDRVLGDEQLEEDEVNLVKSVLWTVVCAKEPVTIRTLSALLEVDADQVSVALQPLRSVLHVSEGSEVVSTLHASFPDFMLNSGRSGPSLFCNEIAHNDYLVKRCFGLMTEQLKFNICALETSYRFDKDVPDLKSRVKTFISPELSYACQYWVDHLCCVSSCRALVDCVDSFLRNQLLFWMEVLNLSGSMRNGPKALGDVCSWLQKGQIPFAPLKFAYDARNFVTTFAANPVRRSTPHIYVSVLPLLSSQNEVRKIYSMRTRGLLKLDGALMNQLDGAALATWNAKWEVTAIACSPDGIHIVSGLSNYTLRIWDGHSGTPLGAPLKGHTNKITSVAFSPDGAWIASGSADRTIRLWDSYSGVLLGSPLEGHTDGITSVAFSPDGAQVISGSADRTIRIWDARQCTPFGSPFEGHTSSISSVLFSPNGARILSTSNNGTTLVWAAHNNASYRGIIDAHRCEALPIAISPNGARVACLSHGFTIQVQDLLSHDSTPLSKPFEGHTNDILCVAFSPDGSFVASGSKDCTVRLWRMDEHNLGLPFEGHTSAVQAVSFSSDGTHVISGSLDGTIRVWDVYAIPLLDSSLGGHTSVVTSVGFSPDGTRILGSSGFMVLIWDAHNGQWLKYLFGELEDESEFSSAVFSPDGSYIAASSQHAISVWDAQRCELLENQCDWHTDVILCIAFSPDSTRLASGSKDCTIQVWDICTGTLLGAPFEGHTGAVHSVSFSPDSTRIASGSSDRTVRIWDAYSGTQIGSSFLGHASIVTAVSFSPDGTRIVSGSADCTIVIWDVCNGNLVGSPFHGHTNWVTSVAFSPDGSRIVSGSHDRTVRVWDICSGALLGVPLEGHTDWIVSVAFSPDGNRIVSGSHDQTVRVWEGIHEPLPALRFQRLDLDDQGWVLDSISRLPVFWCPTELRDIFPRSPNTLTISPHGSIKPNLTEVLMGEAWHECYILHSTTA